jgi:hypothetical protein
MNTGRSAASSSAAREVTEPASGAGAPHRPTLGTEGGMGQGAACTSSGRFSTTVRRCRSQMEYARSTSSAAEAGECTRSDTAPTDRASAS